MGINSLEAKNQLFGKKSSSIQKSSFFFSVFASSIFQSHPSETNKMNPILFHIQSLNPISSNNIRMLLSSEYLVPIGAEDSRVLLIQLRLYKYPRKNTLSFRNERRKSDAHIQDNFKSYFISLRVCT